MLVLSQLCAYGSPFVSCGWTTFGSRIECPNCAMFPNRRLFAWARVNWTVVGFTTLIESAPLTAAIEVRAAVTPFWPKMRS
jgi:hypothetical protein